MLEVGERAEISGVLGGGFRSNAIFFNGAGEETELTLALVSGSGAGVGQKSLNLEIGETDQINNVLGFFGAPDSGGPYTLRVTAVSGGPYSAGLSVIDRQSDDPTFEGAATIWFCNGGGGGGRRWRRWRWRWRRWRWWRRRLRRYLLSDARAGSDLQHPNRI